MQQINGGTFVVGNYGPDGETRAFVYDHQNGEFTDVADLLQMQTHKASSCRSMNANGIVVGSFADLAGARRSYWFDFFSSTPTLHFFDDQFPELTGFSKARDINIHGDVVIESDGGAFRVNPFTGESFPLDLNKPLAITDSGFILSDDYNDPVTNEPVVARWSPLFGKETFTNLKIWTDFGAINELGEFGAIIKNGGAARGTACRVGSSINWTGPNNEAYYVSSVNNSGDLGYMQTVDYREKAFFHHDGVDQVFAIDTLVEDSFLNSGRQNGAFLTERDTTLTIPAPTIVGVVYNEDQSDFRIYFLIPKEPTQTSSETYSTLDENPDPDPPIDIPDNDLAGISSIILAGDHLISGLSVSLNINHPPQRI